MGCIQEYGRMCWGTTANGFFFHLKKTKQEKLEHFQENEEAHEQAGAEKPSCPPVFGTEIAGSNRMIPCRQRRLFRWAVGLGYGPLKIQLPDSCD